MDLTQMQNDLTRLEESISFDRGYLATAKETNEKLLKAEERYAECLEVLKDLREYRTKLSTLLSVCNKKASEYTDSRIALVEQAVEDNLRYIFPEEDFKVRLDLDISKSGRESCQLLLGSKVNGTSERVYASTTAQNGRFVRQLISVVVVYTLNYLRNSDMLYLDEALASSDKKNLTKLKPLLDNIIENGMQIVLIEHKPEFYKDIDRRQFNLLKNRTTGETTIVSCEDIRGSNTYE